MGDAAMTQEEQTNAGHASSGAIEISPASFSSPPGRLTGAPPAVAPNATARQEGPLSIGAIVGIGCGVVVVLVVLSLLLFR